MIQNADRIALRLVSNEWMQQSLSVTRIAAQSMKVTGHAIICGYGRCGQNLARMLEQEGISYIALDFDPDRVRDAAAAGDSVVFGDAARREALVSAGLHRATALIITYADTVSASKVLLHTQQLAPTLPVIVRTVDDADMETLQQKGAAEVVPETLEGSLMLASHALVLLGVPMRRVLRRIAQIRDARYRLLRGYFHGNGNEEDELEHADEQERLHSVHLVLGASAIGASLGEMHLDTLGVSVIAIRRRGIRGIDPSDDVLLMQEDILVLRGTLEKLLIAEQRLLKK